MSGEAELSAAPPPKLYFSRGYNFSGSAAKTLFCARVQYRLRTQANIKTMINESASLTQKEAVTK